MSLICSTATYCLLAVILMPGDPPRSTIVRERFDTISECGRALYRFPRYVEGTYPSGTVYRVGCRARGDALE